MSIMCGVDINVSSSEAGEMAIRQMAPTLRTKDFFIFYCLLFYLGTWLTCLTGMYPRPGACVR